MTWQQHLARLVRSGEARRLRRDAGISQATLACALGYPRTWLSAIETGRIRPGHHTGGPAIRYYRVLAGLARHEQIRSSV